MARRGSVSDLAEMFDNKSKNSESEIKPSQKVKRRKHSKSDLFEKKSNNTESPIKPSQRVKARKHSLSEYFENVFKTQPQAELTQGPRKGDLAEDFNPINDERKQNESAYRSNPGKLTWNTPTQQTISKQTSVGKLNLDAHFADNNPASDPSQISPAIRNKIAVDNNFTELLTSSLNGENQREQEEKDEIYAPAQVKPTEMCQAPKPKARAFFSDNIIGEIYAQPYVVDTISDYVEEGSYPNNRCAFPKAASGTFDGMAVDANTRVIMYEQPNFQGEVLLDVAGPILINNVVYKSCYLTNSISKDFKDPVLQKDYPPNVRVWSGTNMNSWTNGSVKIVAV